MLKIGLSSKGYELSGENFEALKNAGIDAVEISLEPQEYKVLDFKRTKELSEKYGIMLWSFHLPYWPVEDISALDKDLRKEILKGHLEYIKRATDIGIDKFVVHPGGEAGDDEREDRIKASMESLDFLAEAADKNGGEIAVEDLPRGCVGNTVDEMERLLSVNSKLGVCFDTNHLLKNTHSEFLERLGRKIITVHISDYDFVNERHWLPGEGKIDWKQVYNGLKDVGYSGVWMYETRFNPTKSIKDGKRLKFSDFYKNANAIFKGEQIPRIREIKENIGFWD